MTSNSSFCPCGSQKSYTECCEPFHSGKAVPETAEKLMRSRYSAYVKQKIDYVEQTSDPKFRDAFDKDAALEWAKESDWMGLEIVATRDGKSGDAQGEVEFKAHYKREGKDVVHHEVSLFTFYPNEKRWFYTDGKEIREPIRAESKVGRNDPCSCGSGKKYKKCCG